MTKPKTNPPSGPKGSIVTPLGRRKPAIRGMFGVRKNIQRLPRAVGLREILFWALPATGGYGCVSCLNVRIPPYRSGLESICLTLKHIPYLD
jgi:hypothetical protein